MAGAYGGRWRRWSAPHRRGRLRPCAWAASGASAELARRDSRSRRRIWVLGQLGHLGGLCPSRHHPCPPCKGDQERRRAAQARQEEPRARHTAAAAAARRAQTPNDRTAASAHRRWCPTTTRLQQPPGGRRARPATMAPIHGAETGPVQGRCRCCTVATVWRSRRRARDRGHTGRGAISYTAKQVDGTATSAGSSPAAPATAGAVGSSTGSGTALALRARRHCAAATAGAERAWWRKWWRPPPHRGGAAALDRDAHLLRTPVPGRLRATAALPR